MTPASPVLLLTFLGLSAVSCAEHQARAPETGSSPIAVPVASVHREPFTVIYRAGGTVRGRTTAVLTSKIVGYVRTVSVRAGDPVASGQRLAELEANQMRAGVNAARAVLDAAVAAQSEAESALEAATVSAKLAKTTHERIAALFERSAVARQEFDDAEARLHASSAQEQMSRARLRAGRASVQHARAALAESQATLDYSGIVAPFSGRVLERFVDPGALASPGTPLFSIAGEGALQVEVPVEESRTPDVELGEQVDVEIESLGRHLVGRVGEIVPSVDVASRAFLVKIDLPQSTAQVRSGSFARVSFRVGSEPRLVVPSTAISRFGSLDRVFVVERDTARLRMVSLGESQGPWTRVLAGLSENERLVARPPSKLRDGSRVQALP